MILLQAKGIPVDYMVMTILSIVLIMLLYFMIRIAHVEFIKSPNPDMDTIPILLILLVLVIMAAWGIQYMYFNVL